MEKYDTSPSLCMQTQTESSYVAATFKIKNPTGLFLLFLHYLETQVMWEEIRVKHGAYGCMVENSFNYVTFTTHRDPDFLFSVQFFN